MDQTLGVIRVADVGQGGGEIEVLECGFPLGRQGRQIEVLRGAGAPEQTHRLIEIQGDQPLDHGLHRGKPGGTADKPHRLCRGRVDKAQAGGQRDADSAGRFQVGHDVLGGTVIVAMADMQFQSASIAVVGNGKGVAFAVQVEHQVLARMPLDPLASGQLQPDPAHVMVEHFDLLNLAVDVVAWQFAGNGHLGHIYLAIAEWLGDAV